MALDNLDARNTVVVGGGSGIGRGVALALADQGARVLVGDIDADAADAVRDEIVSKGGEAFSTKVDATDGQSLQAAAAEAESKLGGVHVLVHTVGVISDSPVVSASEDDWAWHFEFNLMAAVRDVTAFLPLLRANDEGGHIVVTSSMAGVMAFPPSETGGLNVGAYTVLKHAIFAYGEMLGYELAPEGIGVSVLCPGVVRTNLDETSAANRPARFGGPLPPPKELDLPVRMDPEDAGRIVVEGIRTNRKYIFTHPQLGEFVQTLRFGPLLDDFGFWAERAVAATT
jgi:NAD(P)-dependent dehydrogenase (short-subunit alcohol dehydrogenase family)